MKFIPPTPQVFQLNPDHHMTQSNNPINMQSTSRFLFPNAKRWLAGIGMASILAFHGSTVAATTEESLGTLRALNVDGELLVSICTKGQSDEILDEEGMQLLADTAHKYGFPVTWILRPHIAVQAGDRLKKWHEDYGDEVAWLCADIAPHQADEDFKAMVEATPWQDGIVSAGHIKYRKDWVQIWERLGIEAVWGRCYEQSEADGISDRGSPWGFYYLRPDNYKLPNTRPGGLISVPWLSNDPNMIFWTGLQSHVAFDPDDPTDFGWVDVDTKNYEIYFRLVDQYREQQRFNKVVPLIVQQEYNSPSLKAGVTTEILDGLFAYLKENNVKVVPLREAVRRYKEAAGNSTPPTYGVWANLGDVELIQNPSPRRNFVFEMVRSPISEAYTGAPFNGLYATSRIYQPKRKQLYYSPDGVPFYERGDLFTYYDENGLILFDVNNPKPVRITSYLEVPEGLTGLHVLPELSFQYDTDKYIPGVKVTDEESDAGRTIRMSIEAFQENPMSKERMPYGVMVWGDFSGYQLPTGLPEGAAIVGEHGLFVPFILEANTPVEREIVIKKH
jgi:hypothetical protein